MDTISYSIVTPPAHGVLVGTPPNMVYVPDTDFAGDDALTFRATAGAQSRDRTLRLRVAPQFVRPIGIPEPSFGIEESHSMYADATFDFGAGPEAYRDAGNGPYTHYVDNQLGDDTGNPYGTAANPRKTLPIDLPAGSVVEIHGNGYTESLRHIFRGNGTSDKPIFVRGAHALNKPVLRRPIRIASSWIVVENLEFDAQDFGPSMGSAHNWIVVYEDVTPELKLFHHIAVRHSMVRDQPTFDGANPYSIRVTVNNIEGMSPNNDTDLLTDIVVYDVEVRNFSQWDAFTGNDDYGAVGFGSNTRRCWVLDSHLHHLRGDGTGGNRVGGMPNQAPARDLYIGRNYIHHMKESCVDLKLVSGVVVSQNVCHTVRKSSSSIGALVDIGGNDANDQWPATDDSWIIFNDLFDGEFGIRHVVLRSTPLPQGTAARSYAVGNVIQDIRAINGDPGLVGIGIQKSRLCQSRIINNVIYRCDQGIELGNPNSVEPSQTTQVVRNNIIANLTESFFNLTGMHGMHVFLRSPDLIPYTELNHNLYWEDLGSVRIQIVELGGAVDDHFTVEDLVADTPFGDGSLQLDPQFADAPTANFHLQPASPAIGAGATDQVYALFEVRWGDTIRFFRDTTQLPSGLFNMGAEGVE
jgi:hypothetical protein